MLQCGVEVIPRFIVIQPGGGGNDAEAGDQGDPQGDEAGIDLATGENDIPVGIAHGHNGKNGFHCRVFPGTGEQPGNAHIGSAVHADAAVAPGLGLDVVQQFADVILIYLAERLPAAFGGTGATQIDDDVGVAPFHQRRVGGTDGAERLVIAGKGGDHRKLAVDGIAVFIRWQGHGGGQANAVAHGDQLLGQVDGVRVLLVALIGFTPAQVPRRWIFRRPAAVPVAAIGIVTGVGFRGVAVVGDGGRTASSAATTGQGQCDAKQGGQEPWPGPQKG